MYCLICLEDYDKEHKEIICPKCNKSYCDECLKRWLLMESVVYTCPICKNNLDFNFIYINLSKKFINNDLKKNYANICYQLDKQFHMITYDNVKSFLNIIDKAFRVLFDNYKYTSYNKNNIYYFNFNYSRFKNRSYSVFHLKTNINFNDYPLLLQYKDNYYNDNFKFFIEYIYYKNPNYFKQLNNRFKKYMIDDINNNKYITNKNFKQRIFDITDPLIEFCFHNNLKSIINSKDKIKKDNDYYYLKNFYNILINNNKKLSQKKTFESYKHKIGKCFNNDCDGNVFRYKTQIFCDTCKSIFCVKCYKEIYPQFIEKYNSNKQNPTDDTFILINNPLFSSYSTEQKTPHICNDDDINTVKLLTENVKNCPKCEFPIYKTEGCDHMWCPECHTMFNWSNLQITKTTTNPLYFQWLRQQGLTPQRYNHPDAQPLNCDCNNQLNVFQCNKIINKCINLKNKDNFYNLSNLLELKMKPQNNGSLDMYRIKYIFNLISEEQFKKYITTRYISKFFIDNYNLVIVNFVQTLSDIFHNIETEANLNKDNFLSIKQKNNYLKQFKELINLYNKEILLFHQNYPSLCVYYINDDFTTKTLYISDKSIN